MNRVQVTTQRSCTVSQTVRTLATGLLMTAAAACGSESGGTLGPETGDLTATEATQMFSALVTAYGLAPTPMLPSGGGGGAAGYVPMVTISVDTTQVTTSCPVGGTSSALSHDSIRIVDDTRLNPSPDTTFATNVGFSGRFDITTGFQGCGSTDSAGNTWTFDAAPGLNLVFDFTGSTDLVQLTSGVSIKSWTFAWDGTWSGTLAWSSNGSSGQCDVSMRWTASSLMSAGGTTTTTTNQSGTVCGINVTLTS